MPDIALPPAPSSPTSVSAGRSRTRRVVTAVALVSAGALGATLVTGFAFAAGGGGPTAAQPTSVSVVDRPAAGAGAARAGGLLGRVLHGELTVRAGDGTKVVEVQRGRLTAVSSSSVTVVSTDGFSATYKVTSSTVVRKARQVVGADTLGVGDEVAVRGTGGTATVIRTR